MDHVMNIEISIHIDSEYLNCFNNNFLSFFAPSFLQQQVDTCTSLAMSIF